MPLTVIAPVSPSDRHHAPPDSATFGCREGSANIGGRSGGRRRARPARAVVPRRRSARNTRAPSSCHLKLGRGRRWRIARDRPANATRAANMRLAGAPIFRSHPYRTDLFITRVGGRSKRPGPGRNPLLVTHSGHDRERFRRLPDPTIPDAGRDRAGPCAAASRPPYS